MDRVTSIDLRALGSRLLDTPSSKALRQIEHAIALYVLYRAGKAVVTLGPSGIKKAVTGLVLKGARHCQRLLLLAPPPTRVSRALHAHQ